MHDRKRKAIIECGINGLKVQLEAYKNRCQIMIPFIQEITKAQMMMIATQPIKKPKGGIVVTPSDNIMPDWLAESFRNDIEIQMLEKEGCYD